MPPNDKNSYTVTEINKSFQELGGLKAFTEENRRE